MHDPTPPSGALSISPLGVSAHFMCVRFWREVSPMGRFVIALVLMGLGFLLEVAKLLMLAAQ